MVTIGGEVLSLKEEMAKHRKYEELLKDQAPERTWAMDMPAYCYTAACPVKELRIPARQQKKESGEKSPE